MLRKTKDFTFPFLWNQIPVTRKLLQDDKPTPNYNKYFFNLIIIATNFHLETISLVSFKFGPQIF